MLVGQQLLDPRQCGSSGPPRAGTRRPRCRPARRNGRRPAPRPSRSWRSPAARRQLARRVPNWFRITGVATTSCAPSGSGADGCSSMSWPAGKPLFCSSLHISGSQPTTTLGSHLLGDPHRRLVPVSRRHLQRVRSSARRCRAAPPCCPRPRWVKASVTPAPSAMATSALSTSTRRRRRLPDAGGAVPATGGPWCSPPPATTDRPDEQALPVYVAEAPGPSPLPHSPGAGGRGWLPKLFDHTLSSDISQYNHLSNLFSTELRDHHHV